MRAGPVLRGADLTRLRGLTFGDVRLLARLLAAGVSPVSVPGVIAEYDPQNPPLPPPVMGAPSPVTILAQSFLKDPGQYNGVYGLTPEQAASMSSRLAGDQDAVLKEIREIVEAHHARKKSGRPVNVLLGEVRMSSVGGSAGGGRVGPSKPLIEAHQRYASACGAYTFLPVETGRSAAEAFRVCLGGALCVQAPNKREAIVAARLVRVLGREDPVVGPYVFFFVRGVALRGSDIPADAPSGKGGPSERPEVDAAAFVVPAAAVGDKKGAGASSSK